MSHQEFDRMLTKYLPANTLRNIQDVVESLKSKVRLGHWEVETSRWMRASYTERIPANTSQAKVGGAGFKWGDNVEGFDASTLYRLLFPLVIHGLGTVG